eukprot:scaffold19854_cov64-Phaeocystis_antarctica.AAC.6
MIWPAGGASHSPTFCTHGPRRGSRATKDGQLLATRAKDHAVGLKHVARPPWHAAQLRDFLLLLLVPLDSQARTEAGLTVESLAGPATHIPRQAPGRATSCSGGGQRWRGPGERRATRLGRCALDKCSARPQPTKHHETDSAGRLSVGCGSHQRKAAADATLWYPKRDETREELQRRKQRTT